MRTERFRRILEAAGSADPKWFASKKTTYRKVRVSVCWFRKTIEPALFCVSGQIKGRNNVRERKELPPLKWWQLSLSKNYANAPASAIIEETGVFTWKAGEKMHGMSQSS